jgi:DNA-directed RNA polymerase specialized sigma24 family protein
MATADRARLIAAGKRHATAQTKLDELRAALDAEIRQARAGGLSVREVASLAGVPIATVQRAERPG